jgi:hypothetical protein
MNRRGFFSKIFTSNKMPNTFFFGFQAVIGSYASDTLRQDLHRIIGSGPEEEKPIHKRKFYKRVSSLLLECLPAVEYGYWDYITDPDKAEAEFHSWVNEIEATMSTEDEELTETTENINRLSTEKNYIAVTCVFLLEGSSVLEEFMGIIESIGEDEYWDKATFQKLIESVNYIDFEYSYGDAAFIMPGNEEDGLSWEDIHGEGWEYLKPIM